MDTLFDPLTIGSVTFHNRVWVSPMCQYSASDGFVGAWHSAHLNAFATGGPGLIMVEATGVVPEGRISIACPTINDDAHAAAFKPMIDFAHSQNVKIGIQLAHAGRKGATMRPWDDHRMATLEEGGWQSVSSSAIAFHGYPEPRALTIDEIHQLTQDFVDAAKRAVNVGFDVIEIHAAHGYLLHQFYSPLGNTRSDEYGGSFENRVRFLLETVKAVRGAIPSSVPLFVRISATDWVDDGWNLVDSIELCTQLKALGVDLIDVSTGGNVHNAPIKATPGFQVPFAAAIRAEAAIMTAAVGLITEPEQAQYIIETGEADAVFLARAMIRNPRWALNAAEKLGVKIAWPHQLERGQTI
ncbi:MAG: NADH:flavin oxidoreductase/NADH oxidase [Streptomycetaceae bacterium]|nr:MAG: NADH:flavin oxidoreductase/NADH oxidase [Streptomycetaceae bacterium]